jgi:hypothetical protein
MPPVHHAFKVGSSLFNKDPTTYQMMTLVRDGVIIDTLPYPQINDADIKKEKMVHRLRAKLAKKNQL